MGLEGSSKVDTNSETGGVLNIFVASALSVFFKWKEEARVSSVAKVGLYVNHWGYLVVEMIATCVWVLAEDRIGWIVQLLSLVEQWNSE